MSQSDDLSLLSGLGNSREFLLKLGNQLWELDTEAELSFRMAVCLVSVQGEPESLELGRERRRGRKREEGVGRE